jgi:hypothetical protein
MVSDRHKRLVAHIGDSADYRRRIDDRLQCGTDPRKFRCRLPNVFITDV